MSEWTVIGMSFALAAVLTPLWRSLAARIGFLDQPNERSSHRRVTPRGGGIALVAAVGVSLLAAPVDWTAGRVGLGLGALLVALVGLWDDRFGLSPLVRFAFHLAAALGLVLVVGGLDRFPLPPPLDLPLGPLGGPLAVLWIVAAINFYNFMDGIDGIAALQGLVTGGGLALLGGDPFAQTLGAALAAGCLGFLLYNWSPASIFMGDIGSGFLGFAIAALPLLTPPPGRASAVLFVAISLGLFLSDASFILFRRVVRGERWYHAHREHLYQRLVATGLGHATVTGGIGLGAAVLTALALVASRTGEPRWTWAALAAGAALYALEAALVRRRESR